MFPVIVTAANISQIEASESDNLVELSGQQGQQSNTEEVLDQTAMPTILETSAPEGNSRTKREVLSENLHADVCVVGNLTLKVNESISLKGCTLLTCQPENGILYPVVYT